jgi:hypothetical protein
MMKGNNDVETFLGGNTRPDIWEGKQVYVTREQEPDNQCQKLEAEVYLYIFA